MSVISSSEPRPDFLLIGAQKAGTTSLFFDLRNQPGIFIPAEKELRVLSQEDDTAIVTDYRKHFSSAPAGSRRGDGSTDYAKRTEHSGVPERTKRVLGSDVKLIYMIREPVQRLLSHYHHQCNLGKVIPLPEALDSWPQLIDNSRYGFQLEAWRAHYSLDAIHVVFFEDYKRDRAGVVRSCCEFLGTTFSASAVGAKVHNQSDGKPKADAKIQVVKDWWLYRKLIRPLVPLEARLWLVHKISAKAAPRSKTLPDPCVERVSAIFAEDRGRLHDLLGRDAPWQVPVE